MGCGTSKEYSLSKITPASAYDKGIEAQIIPSLDITNPINVNAKYNYLVKLNPNKFVGKGIHETMAYDCLVTRQELARKRAEFWDTRTEGNPAVWKSLRYAVESSDIESIVESFQRIRVKLVKGKIQTVFDDKRHKFDLPVWMINEPDSYAPEPMKAAIESKNVSISIS